MKIALCVGQGVNYGPGWVGYDIVDTGFRPLVLQDVRTLDGRRFRDAELILASPPCTEFTLANPRYPGNRHPNPDLSIVEACFRIGREAGVPFILENVRGAQRWLGKATAHRGPWYFWGDVGLLPLGRFRKDTDKHRRQIVGATIPKALIP